MTENRLIPPLKKWKDPDVFILYNSTVIDGYFSGAIAKMYYMEQEDIDVMNIGVDNEEKDEPFLEQFRSKTVILLDICYDIILMKKIMQLAKNIVWIDNSKEAIEKYEKHLAKDERKDENAVLQSVFNTEKTTCELTWEHFYPQKETPEAIRFLGEYYAGKKKDFENWNNYILPFKYGVDHYYKSIDDIDLKIFSEKELTYQVMQAGRTILRYQEQRDKKACKGIFFTRFDGYNAICLNIGGADFNIFRSVWDQKKYDIAIAFYFSRDYWKYKIFSDKPDINCGDIVKVYGGRGKKEIGWFYSFTNLLLDSI